MYKLLLALLFTTTTSIYTYSITDVNGNAINLSSYEGKSILLVNIATGSEHVSQLAGLQDLYNQYHDSLVIIAFPSNSFGHESRSNSEIKQFCTSNYNASFVIAAKNAVTGPGMQSVYDWLAHSNLNGAMDGTVVGDFQKFLINRNGDLIGTFSPKIEPNSQRIKDLITAD